MTGSFRPDVARPEADRKGAARPEPSREPTLEDLETDLLLEGIWRRYGHDLREFDRRFIRSRVQERLRQEGLENAIQLLDRVLRDRPALEAFLEEAGEPAESFFRPARVWLALRKRAVPRLRTYPSVRAWLIGSSAEQDLSPLAILFQEDLARSYTLYATGLWNWRLRPVRVGVFRRSRMRELARNYSGAGGRKHLSDYLTMADGEARLNPEMMKRTLVASHNLATDSSFNEFHLIMARGTLSRFNKELRARSLRLMHESLIHFGFLALEPGESLAGSPLASAYLPVARGSGLFQKISY